MKTALLKRLKRLEQVRIVENRVSVEFQMRYLKKLAEELAGERHIVTVGRAADGKYPWEERPVCPQPVKTAHVDHQNRLGAAKDGGPDYSWLEDAHA